MANHSVPAAAEGVPTIIPPFVNVSALRGLPMKQLLALQGDVRALREVASAMTNRPCYSVPAGLNAAGEQIEAIDRMLSECLTVIRETADLHFARTEADARARADVIAIDDAHTCDSIEDHEKLTAELARDVTFTALREGGAH